ncbi:MAG: AraC family transcriptional regulator [Devosia nanyangense]|uniref:AraC family transcriptional regulator n=1 Tax=Devosia nanyangense TaxID=1228055 RepID=A0A933L6D8_9HYPH|nr:AraC family transcriptional regulator [Devosia nanyangense]
MKPFLEKLQTPDGASWAWLDRKLEDGIPFQWHHHPEFELTLTLNSRGQRFIGDHIGDYTDGDLVLIGPNLPHTWVSRERVAPGPHVAQVMWFHPDWAAALGATLVEMKPVTGLLARARMGLRFSETVSAAARPRIAALFARPAEDRVLALLELLQFLAADAAAAPLASPAAAAPAAPADRTRIDRVLDYIHLNYAGGVCIPELADIAALSPSGLHRLFRRHTRQTITDYVTALRIGEACALLSGTGRPVAHIAADIGYDSLANFNRRFKALKAMTPREYRAKF